MFHCKKVCLHLLWWLFRLLTVVHWILVFLLPLLRANFWILRITVVFFFDTFQVREYFLLREFYHALSDISTWFHLELAWTEKLSSALWGYILVWNLKLIAFTVLNLANFRLKLNSVCWIEFRLSLVEQALAPIKFGSLIVMNLLEFLNVTN